MTSLKKEKTITKLYPAQIANYQNQLMVYSPLEHWVELHSSVSIKDIIEIQGDASPYFLNHSNQKIILQNERTLMTEWSVQQNFSKIGKIYEHSHRFASETVSLNEEYFVNLDETGSLSLLTFHRSQNNPQSLKQISFSTKASIQFGSVQNVESSINVNSLHKTMKNGLNLSELGVDQQRIFTLHRLESDEESWTKVFKTELNQSQSLTSSLRAYLPSSIKSLLVKDNSIWVYGKENLSLMDIRSQTVVLKMNDILDTEINYVRRHANNDNLLYICRNSSILLQDARKPSQIVEVVLNNEQNIEFFDLIKEDKKDVFCISSTFDGKIYFYKNNYL